MRCETFRALFGYLSDPETLVYFNSGNRDLCLCENSVGRVVFTHQPLIILPFVLFFSSKARQRLDRTEMNSATNNNTSNHGWSIFTRTQVHCWNAVSTTLFVPKGLYVVSEALSPYMTALLLHPRPCYSAPPRSPRAQVPQPRNPDLLALFRLASVERSAA